MVYRGRPARPSAARRQRIAADQLGDLLWTCAEGTWKLIDPDRTDRLPDRLVGILQRIDDGWRWRLFSGSQPIATPAQQAG